MSRSNRWRHADSWRAIAPGVVGMKASQVVDRAAKRAQDGPGWQYMTPEQRQHAVSHEVLTALAELDPERASSAFFVAIASAALARTH